MFNASSPRVPPVYSAFVTEQLVLVRFAGAFRRSELAFIHIADLAFSNDAGLVVHLRHSKTDQEGASREVAIPFGELDETCPVRALQSYLLRLV